MKKQVFKTKPGKKVMLQNLATLAMTGVLIAVVIWRKEALSRIMWMVPAAAVLCIYVLDAMLSTTVTITDTRVVAKAGHLSVRRIPLDQIQAVLPSISHLQPAPTSIQVLALGDKRLYLLLQDGSAVCISPYEQQEFIQSLVQQIPGLQTQVEEHTVAPDAMQA